MTPIPSWSTCINSGGYASRRARYLASGEYDHAAVLLREADGCGGAGAGRDRGGWVAGCATASRKSAPAAILEQVECELELGRHAELVGELSGLLAQYPLDETFIAHQMTALYWSGRPGDALSLFRQTRDSLIEEQGAEPGPALPNCTSASCAGTLTWMSGSRAAGHDRSAVLDTLPPESAEFVGRDDELAMLTAEHGD